jgi:hypothetical protein
LILCVVLVQLQKFWIPRAKELVETTLKSHNYCCGERQRLSGFTYRCRGGTCFVKYGCVYWLYDPQDNEDAIIFCQASMHPCHSVVRRT